MSGTRRSATSQKEGNLRAPAAQKVGKPGGLAMPPQIPPIAPVRAPVDGKHSGPEFIILDWNEWASKVVPPREKLMVPIIPKKGLVEVFAKRGVGKTFLSLGIAIAIATGTDFLHWSVPKPQRVLYVDGEMAFADLQERANWMVANLTAPPQPGFLRLFAADLQNQGIPDLASEDATGRNAINKALDLGGANQVELLVLDNLSTLTNTGSENSDEAWAYMQEWLLKLRRGGVTVLFVHHAGKSGAQRGTSKREDALDTVIKLTHPKDYKASDGSRFEISFEKHRGFFDKDAEPFEAKFRVKDEVGSWDTKPLGKSAQIRLVTALKAGGSSVRDIEAKTGISKTKAQRLLAEGRTLAPSPSASKNGTIKRDKVTPH